MIRGLTRERQGEIAIAFGLNEHATHEELWHTLDILQVCLEMSNRASGDYEESFTSLHRRRGALEVENAKLKESLEMLWDTNANLEEANRVLKDRAAIAEAKARLTHAG